MRLPLPLLAAEALAAVPALREIRRPVMICPPCREAGRALARGEAFFQGESPHEQCPGGTWCDCQHKSVTALRQPGGDR